MNIVWFWIVTLIFALVAVAMILIILVQRPQGGGLVGAFGGASAGGTETVFGGRVGDALTYSTVTAFALFLALAITLNLLDITARPPPAAAGVSAPGTQLPGGEMPPGLPGTPGSPVQAHPVPIGPPGNAPATIPAANPPAPAPPPGAPQ